MATTYAFAVKFPGTGGLPADTMVNTWHFTRVPGPVTDYDNVRDMLKDFYTKVPSGETNRISTYMSQYAFATNTPTVAVVAYNLDDPAPRAPVYQSSFVLTPTSTNTQLPSEVAICASFRTEVQSGVDMRRRRNRIYLPGLTNTTLVQGTGRVLGAFQTIVAKSLKELAEASNASVNWGWVVRSPTDNQCFTVKYVWVDDAYDIQRRRGLKPTTRVSYVTDSGTV